jgi:hypothetical protein
MQVPTTALPPSSPQVSPDARIETPQTAPSIRPRRRHPYAHDGAMYTRTNSVHESQPGFSRMCVMVFDPPKAARPLAFDQLGVDQSPHSWADSCLG